jgi:glycosyltransferase involved in cell wall biosynthesis
MNILYVVHYFLPEHQAGTEIYTALLAKELNGQGHHVEVFTSEDGNPEGGRFALEQDSWDGVPVARLIRGEPPDFERSYADPEIDRIFRSFLEERRPDAVHFQHTFRLSAGMIRECKEAGVPSLVTLADFWFVCPPIIMLKPGLEICPGPEIERCARCGNAIGALYSGAAAHEVWDRAVRAAHSLKRRLPSPLVERARRWKQSREMADPGSGFRKRAALLSARQEFMRNALAHASLVIAPSKFLREKMIEAGAVEPDSIIHSDYGFDHEPFKNKERKDSPHLRFGFIGTPVEHKGAHVAVEAMNRLADTDAELLVYGDLSWYPAYARRLKKVSRNPRTRFMGRFDNKEAAKILASIDVLVVPSLWYENSPLTIHEAFMAGAPVITSDIGGMAELVENGGGITFRTGDPDDLARAMRGLIERPDEIGRLRKNIPAVKSIEENADELVKLYSHDQ